MFELKYSQSPSQVQDPGSKDYNYVIPIFIRTVKDPLCTSLSNFTSPNSASKVIRIVHKTNPWKDLNNDSWNKYKNKTWKVVRSFGNYFTRAGNKSGHRILRDMMGQITPECKTAMDDAKNDLQEKENALVLANTALDTASIPPRNFQAGSKQEQNKLKSIIEGKIKEAQNNVSKATTDVDEARETLKTAQETAGKTLNHKFKSKIEEGIIHLKQMGLFKLEGTKVKVTYDPTEKYIIEKSKLNTQSISIEDLQKIVDIALASNTELEKQIIGGLQPKTPEVTPPLDQRESISSATSVLDNIEVSSAEKFTKVLHTVEGPKFANLKYVLEQGNLAKNLKNAQSKSGKTV